MYPSFAGEGNTLPKFITAGRVMVVSLAVGPGVVLIVLRLMANSWSDFLATEAVKYLGALSIVVLVTVSLHVLFRLSGLEGNRGLLCLILGQDRRVSKSKFQVAL